MTKGSSSFVKPFGSSEVLLSTGTPAHWPPDPVPHRELRLLCLWRGNQAECSVGTTSRARLSPQPGDMDAFLSKSKRTSAPHFIAVLLAQCLDPSWQNCSQGSAGKEDLGCEHLNSLFFNLDHGLCFSAEGRTQTFCCSSYYNYLGPFSITVTLMRTQECLHLCQNTWGKPLQLFIFSWVVRHIYWFWLHLADARRRAAVTLSEGDASLSWPEVFQ